MLLATSEGENIYDAEEMRASGVYAITNVESKKVYVGSTLTPFWKRWGNHKSRLRKGYHNNPHLQSSWDKYGESAFKFTILEKLGDPKKMVEREQYWLDYWRERCPVYNTGKVAIAPFLGRTHSTETRQRLREINTGKTHSEETRRRLSKISTGRQHSEETKRKMSRSREGKPSNISTEGRARISAAVKERQSESYPQLQNLHTGEIVPVGRNISELCRKLGLNKGHLCAVIRGAEKHHKGWVIDGNDVTPGITQEGRERIRQRMLGNQHAKGRTWTPEERKNHATAVNREKMAAAQRGKKATAETRAKMSLAHQGEKHPGARLSAEDVRCIRKRAGEGESKRALAQNYGVSYEHLCRIAGRRAWKCVP